MLAADTFFRVSFSNRISNWFIDRPGEKSMAASILALQQQPVITASISLSNQNARVGEFCAPKSRRASSSLTCFSEPQFLSRRALPENNKRDEFMVYPRPECVAANIIDKRRSYFIRLIWRKTCRIDFVWMQIPRLRRRVKDNKPPHCFLFIKREADILWIEKSWLEWLVEITFENVNGIANDHFHYNEKIDCLSVSRRAAWDVRYLYQSSNNISVLIKHSLQHTSLVPFLFARRSAVVLAFFWLR